MTTTIAGGLIVSLIMLTWLIWLITEKNQNETEFGDKDVNRLIPANTDHWPINVGLMLVNRLRRWPNIEPTVR